MKPSFFTWVVIFIFFVTPCFGYQHLTFSDNNFSIDVPNNFSNIPTEASGQVYRGSNGHEKIIAAVYDEGSFKVDDLLTSDDFMERFASRSHSKIDKTSIQQINGYRFLVVEYSNNEVEGVCYLINADTESIALYYNKPNDGTPAAESYNARQLVSSLGFITPPTFDNVTVVDDDSSLSPVRIRVIVTVVAILLVIVFSNFAYSWSKKLEPH